MLLEEPGGGGAVDASPLELPAGTEQYTMVWADCPAAVDQPLSQAHPQELSTEPCTPQAGCTRQLLADALLSCTCSSCQGGFHFIFAGICSAAA